MAKGAKKKKEPTPQAVFLRRLLFGILGIIILFFGVKSCYYFFIGFDRDMHENYEELRMGHSISVAEESLGEPDKTGQNTLDRFPVMNYNDLRDRAERSGAITYYYYDNGFTTMYILGFNKNRSLCFKEKVSK